MKLGTYQTKFLHSYFIMVDLSARFEHELPPLITLRVGPGVFPSSLCYVATSAKCLAVARVKHRAAVFQWPYVVNLVTPFAARLAAVRIPVKHPEPEPIPA